MLYGTEDLPDHLWRGPGWLRPAAGRVALGLLLLALPQMYGVGYPVLEAGVRGQYVLWFLAVLLIGKIAATSLTIGTVAVSGGDGMGVSSARRARWRRYWDRHSTTYDREMRFFDRVLFGDTRRWICQQVTGEVLEVAIGTGLNLEHYPADVALTGIELSHDMLAIARRRADELGRRGDFRFGDAEALDFLPTTFDTVVCTFSLCAIPDHRKALAEMIRVLRPGGMLLLADHVASSVPAVRAGQRVLELATIPLGGEHFLRRPSDQVRAAGLQIENHDRFAAGIVERLAARKLVNSGDVADPCCEPSPSFP